jgi:hypothetical protein
MRRHVLLTMRGPLQLTAGGGGHRLPPRQRFSPFAFRSADLFREWDPAVERADRPPWGIAFPAGVFLVPIVMPMFLTSPTWKTGTTAMKIEHVGSIGPSSIGITARWVSRPPATKPAFGRVINPDGSIHLVGLLPTYW